MNPEAKVIPLRRSAASIELLSDEALVAACAAGDASALALLFDRRSDDVTRFLGRMAYVDQQDVEDMVSEVFLAVFRGAGSYRSDSSVKTWMFAIAANVARQRSRKMTRGRAVLDRLTRELARPDTRSTESALVARDLVERVARCVPLLPHDLRTVFVMCDVEEIPGIDVARALGVPTGTVYRRLHDAHKQLRKLIDGGRS